MWPDNSLLLTVFQIRDAENADVVTNAAEIAEWKSNDVEARNLVYSTMKPEQQVGLQGCSTAFEMWTRILMEYAETTVESVPLLWSQFYSYKFQSGN